MAINIDFKFDATEAYKDALQPTVKQIGGTLEDLTKTARLLLFPFLYVVLVMIDFRNGAIE
ncbi:hypothetical protein [Helicobacter trogontum]|uniref:Uncharacterized protein n=1 Tax=Helicobacter trogontum TaxID=50960 RepID=A0A4U8SFD2_9HELI|nr:hypothetical protein [Helicobacter trogontum]TLD84871.1 hypothetical protein LS81_000405 [Helicobacter trogontum]